MMTVYSKAQIQEDRIKALEVVVDCLMETDAHRKAQLRLWRLDSEYIATQGRWLPHQLWRLKEWWFYQRHCGESFRVFRPDLIMACFSTDVRPLAL